MSRHGRATQAEMGRDAVKEIRADCVDVTYQRPHIRERAASVEIVLTDQ